jgi:hypothetical protein
VEVGLFVFQQEWFDLLDVCGGVVCEHLAQKIEDLFLEVVLVFL